MKGQTQIRKWASLLAATGALITLAASQINAAGTGQLGILDTTGNNPATGSEWQVGENYRLVFISSGNVDPTDTSGGDLNEISTWNGFAQSFANGSTTYTNLGSVNWSVIGSTETVDARTNTLTDPNVNGDGHSIMLIDGSTVIADDFNDLWDGSIQNIIDLNENGSGGNTLWPYTGTLSDGTANNYSSSIGPLRDVSTSGQISQGQGNDTSGWINRDDISSIAADNVPLTIYAMSETLTVVPEASTGLLIGLAGLALLRRRR